MGSLFLVLKLFKRIYAQGVILEIGIKFIIK